MQKTISINEQPVSVKEYKGNKVVTFQDIDIVHGRAEGTARKRFYDNNKHFIEGEDYYNLQKSEKRTLGFQVPNRGMIVLTESGYLMLAKSFTDDLAWKVQRQLVNCCFRTKAEDTEKLYEYFDKTYNNVPVLTSTDVSHFTGINRSTVDYYLRTNGERNTDYFYAEGDELKKFKKQNSCINKMSNSLYLITKVGFMKLCKAYGVKVETPKCFECKNETPKSNDVSYVQRVLNKLKQSCNVGLYELTPEVASIITDGKIVNQSVAVKNGDRYMIYYDCNAPLHTRRYIVSQAIVSIVMGQLDGCRYEKPQGNENKVLSIHDYSEQVNQFASMLTILALANE